MPKKPVIFPETLAFLQEIAENNTKTWFEPQKPRYKRIKSQFEVFLEALLGKIIHFDPFLAALAGKTSLIKVFRIYRDTRFSKKKTPLKENLGGVIAVDRNGKNQPCYYVHLQPNGQSFVGGGVYAPDRDILAQIRDFGAKNPQKWPKIFQNEAFSRTFGDVDRHLALKTLPRGYEKDHPQKSFLKLQSFTATTPISDQIVLGSDFFALAEQICSDLWPLQHFLYEALAEKELSDSIIPKIRPF